MPRSPRSGPWLASKWSLLLSAALLLACSTIAAAQDDHSADIDIETAPVEVDGHFLFRLRGASSISAEARAERIAKRIADIGADSTIAPGEVQVRDADGALRIMARDRYVMTVTEPDARLEQMGRADLASINVTRVRQAIEDYRQARGPEALRRGLWNAIAATVVIVIAAAGLWFLTRRLRNLLGKWVERRVAATTMDSLDIVRAERIAESTRQALHLLAGLILLGLIFEYLSFTLSQFPGTRALGNNVSALLVGPLQTMGTGLVAQLPNLAFLVVLFIVVRVVLRAVRAVFDAIGRGALHLSGFEAEWATPTYKIVRFAVIVLAVVVAYPYLPGAQSEAFKGISIFVGVLFSIGSSSAISNLIAGYILIYRRVFKVGDLVKIANIIGEVTEFRIQATRVRSFKNEEIVFPNSQILGTEVTNYSVLQNRQGLILHTEVGIGYETPWRQVEAMLLAAAQRTPGILHTPPPFVLQRALANFSVTYELNVYCANATRMLEVYADLHRQILDAFNEYGVQITSPNYEADPAEKKIVPREKWFPDPVLEQVRKKE